MPDRHRGRTRGHLGSNPKSRRRNPYPPRRRCQVPNRIRIVPIRRPSPKLRRWRQATGPLGESKYVYREREVATADCQLAKLYAQASRTTAD